MTTKLILVGGFLGSGKTTLLREAARRLARESRATGLITNDQAPDLVDTALLSRSGAAVQEVSGSCFCCNFDGFTAALKALAGQKAEVVIAEPVGSCTDLSATVMQPLKDRHPEIDLAPLTVLADPGRVREVLRKKPSLMHMNALYILRLQLLEADRILLNKVDTLSAAERRELTGLLRGSFPGKPVGEISALSGAGVDDWLASVLNAGKAGERIVEVDYDRYAEGEAVLGWLNATAGLECAGRRIEWGDYARELMEDLHQAFKRHGVEVGHLKLMIGSDEAQCTANLTHLEGGIAVRTDPALQGDRADLTLNARVQMPPEKLEGIVRDVFAASGRRGTRVSIRTLRCLSPGRPDPTHRYSHSV